MLSIITDTSSLYTPEQAKELGFHVVPLHVLYNGISKRDLVEIDGNGLLEDPRLEKRSTSMSNYPNWVPF